MKTIEEMHSELKEYCYKHKCDDCLFESDLEGHFCDVELNKLTDEMIVHDYNLLYPPGKQAVEITKTTNVENDVIKHPSHYCREGAMECIDEMILLFGKEVVKHFCLCNCWKYRYRSNAKNGKEDIEKSDQYMRIYKGLCNGESQTI